jgi:hypothetical protein
MYVYASVLVLYPLASPSSYMLSNMLPFPVRLNGLSFSATLDDLNISVLVLGVIGISGLRALLLDLDVALADGPF